MTTGRLGCWSKGNAAASAKSLSTVLQDYGPEEAAISRSQAVGTTGSFQGPLADLEQRKPQSTPPGQQYLSRNYGPGCIRRTALPEYTAASGRLDHATFWERADASVRCTGLGVKLYMPRSNEALAGGNLFIIDAKMFFR